MNTNALQGTGVALVTPFNSNLEIDTAALRKLVNHVIDGGVNYLVVNGTTAESVTTSAEEKQLLINLIVAYAEGRVPIVAGFGGNHTQQVIDDIKTFDLTGVDYLLSVSPAYNKPTQDGIYAHYKAIAESTDLPIILYNVPGRTAKNMEASTTIRLANDFDNIIAIKEATYDLEQITNLVLNRPVGFLLLSGCDDLIFHEMALGFDGVISVVANSSPKPFTQMINLCLNNDFAAAKQIQLDLYRYIFMLFEQGNPAGVKCVLKHLDICDEYVRLPLVEVDEDLRSRLKTALEGIASYN